MSGQHVNNHNRPNKGRQLSAERTISYLLFSQVCLRILVLLRLHHRQYRTCLHQVQSKSEVTNQHRATGARLTKTTKNQNKKKNDNRDSDESLRDLPEWLEEFTDNLKDTEMPVLAHISQDSDSEHPTRVVSKSKEAQYLCSLPKRSKLRSMLADKDDRGSL